MSKTINTGFITDKINKITVNTSLKCNTSNYTNSASRTVSYIVMHYTGNIKDTAKANANYFTGANREASAHLFVDNSNIYQSVELRDVAWHCGTKKTYYHNDCRNANSIGIEMCCTDGNYKISKTTQQNSAYLCAYLCKMIGIGADGVDKYVLRHYDITHKTCPAQMVDNASEWTAFKTMVKNLLTTNNIDGKVAKATTTTTTSALSAGTKLSLSKTPIYTSSTALLKAGTKTGTYYVWSKDVVKNRIRITNNKSYVGKSGQVIGWVNYADAKKCAVATSTTSTSSATTTTIQKGSKVKIKSGAVYGGVANTRGTKIGSAYINKVYTVSDIATNKGVKEALIKELFSWVAVSSLTIVS